MAAALPIPDEDDLPISIEGLKNILECPVCLSPPTSTPIYRCDNGHILCSVCRSKVKICPECRIELGNLRCLTSEKIVTAMLPKVELFYFHTYKYCIEILYSRYVALSFKKYIYFYASHRLLAALLVEVANINQSGNRLHPMNLFVKKVA